MIRTWLFSFLMSLEMFDLMRRQEQAAVLCGLMAGVWNETK